MRRTGKKLTAVTPKQTLDAVEKQEITTVETQSTTAIEMVYYSATGSYWHLSEECAEEDYVTLCTICRRDNACTEATHNKIAENNDRRRKNALPELCGRE